MKNRSAPLQGDEMAAGADIASYVCATFPRVATAHPPAGGLAHTPAGGVWDLPKGLTFPFRPIPGKSLLSGSMPFYKGIYSPGGLQFITTRTYRRAPLFRSERFCPEAQGAGAQRAGWRRRCLLTSAICRRHAWRPRRVGNPTTSLCEIADARLRGVCG